MASDVTAIVSGVRGVAIFPRVVFNSSLDINLYFKDAAGNFQAYSGSASYTPKIRIRPSGWVGNLSVTGSAVNSIDITDGSKTRPFIFANGPLTVNGLAGQFYQTAGLGGISNSDGTLGRTVYYGINAAIAAANAADPWVFNNGASPVSLNANAVWAGTGVDILESASNGSAAAGTPQTGLSAIISAHSVGAQAALSFTNAQNLYPAPDTQVDVLQAGSASLKAIVWLRVTPKPYVTVSSFGSITNGWSCSVPFTDYNFALGVGPSAGGGSAVYPFNDFTCEMTVTRNSDGVVMAVVVATIRVYRKQIEITL